MALMLLVIAAAVAAGTWIWMIRFRGLPPGPWGLPVVGYLPWLAGEQPHIKLTRLADQYGPIYSIRMGNVFTVVVSEPQLIRQAFAMEEYTGRAPLFLTHGIMKNNGIICVQGEKWKEMRKFIRTSLRSLGMVKFGPARAKMENDIGEGVQQVIASLHHISGHPVDPEPILIHVLGNVLFRLVFGKTWSEDDSTWKTLQHLQEEGTKLIGVSAPINFLPFLRFVPQFQRNVRFIEEGIDFTHEIYQEILSEFEASGEAEQSLDEDSRHSPQHLMAAYVAEMRKRGGHFDRTQFNFLMADIFGAGVDTTLATLRWFLLYMALHPEWQERVRSELSELTECGPLRLDHLQRSSVLEACICETQRIRSVTPVGIPHGTTKESFLGGYVIPAGTMVMPLLWAVHMNPNSYEKPEQFNPNRFLTADNKFSKSSYFLPFQSGKRICVGEEYAKNLLLLFGGSIINEFSLSVPDGVVIDLDGEPGITLNPHRLGECSMRPRHVISLSNISSSETFAHSLPLVKGYVSGCGPHSPNEIILRAVSSATCTRWPVVNGNFKCLPELELGKNSYQLEFDDAVLYLELDRRALASPYHVLPVYIICSDHDGSFQGPDEEDCSPESARRRIALGSRLIQAVTAEKLHELELGRRTFQLASDLNQNLDCILFRTQLSSSTVYEMAQEELWEHFGRELVSSKYGRDDRKFLAFLSCTRYLQNNTQPLTHDEVVSRVQGHVALGGGGLAIFGTGCLHTWPEQVQHVISRFNDDTKVDKFKFMDDSCYRGTWGSCFSTTLGAVCHELGHTFDLGHAKTGIMARGFDNIRLVFTVGSQQRDTNRNVVTRSDAQHATVAFTRDLNVTVTVEASPRRHTRPPIPSVTSPASVTHPNNTTLIHRHQLTNKVPVDDLTFWDRSSAVLLRYHRWFADSSLDHHDFPNSSIDYDVQRWAIKSAAGVRVVELRGDDGLILCSWQFLSTWVPKQFIIPVNCPEMQHARTVVAQDSIGNIIKHPLTPGT